MIRALLVLALFLTCATASAAQSERYAAFVADMDTGEILHARQADSPRYPASLTKMMTLYMMFDALEQGNLTLTTQMTASAEAAARPASHLGLAEGDTLTVDEAIRALIVQSANDVAVVVAEHLGETEAAFAQMMTRRSQELGLRQTRFENASGLPARSQRTTARDMARLAHALRRDFPQYWPYFAHTEFRWGNTTHRSHNTLVGTLEGVDGLKTGYIRASGFHVAATAERNERRLVAIILGGASPAVRDGHARELIEAGFAALTARDEGRKLAALNLPRLNPVREQDWLTAELRGSLRTTEMGSASGVPGQPAQILFDDPAPVQLSLERLWSVQVGAYGSRETALARLNGLVAAQYNAIAADARVVAEPLETANLKLWRARFTDLDAEGARALCRDLETRGEACFTVAPGA